MNGSNRSFENSDNDRKRKADEKNVHVNTHEMTSLHDVTLIFFLLLLLIFISIIFILPRHFFRNHKNISFMKLWYGISRDMDSKNNKNRVVHTHTVSGDAGKVAINYQQWQSHIMRAPRAAQFKLLFVWCYFDIVNEREFLQICIRNESIFKWACTLEHEQRQRRQEGTTNT